MILKFFRVCVCAFIPCRCNRSDFKHVAVDAAFSVCVFALLWCVWCVYGGGQ